MTVKTADLLQCATRKTKTCQYRLFLFDRIVNRTVKGYPMTTPDFLPTLSSGAHGPGSGRACVMEYVSLLAGEKWSDMPSCTHPALARAAQRVNDSLPDEHRHLLVPLIGRLFGTNKPIDDKAFGQWLARKALASARSVEHLSSWAKEMNDSTEQYLAGALSWDQVMDVRRSRPLASAAAYADADADAATATDAYAYASAAAYAAADAYAYADAYADAYAAAYAATDAYAYAYAATDAYAAASVAGGVARGTREWAQNRVNWLASIIDKYDELAGRTQHREVTPTELRQLADAVSQ